MSNEDKKIEESCKPIYNAIAKSCTKENGEYDQVKMQKIIDAIREANIKLEAMIIEDRSAVLLDSEWDECDYSDIIKPLKAGYDE